MRSGMENELNFIFIHLYKYIHKKKRERNKYHCDCILAAMLKMLILVVKKGGKGFE